jgi:hypothetical protein
MSRNGSGLEGAGCICLYFVCDTATVTARVPLTSASPGLLSLFSHVTVHTVWLQITPGVMSYASLFCFLLATNYSEISYFLPTPVFLFPSSYFTTTILFHFYRLFFLIFIYYVRLFLSLFCSYPLSLLHLFQSLASVYSRTFYFHSFIHSFINGSTALCWALASSSVS